MLTAELKVNGVLIGVLYIHNLDGEPTSNYEVVYHDIGYIGSPLTSTFSSTFSHCRADGALRCVENALGSLKDFD